MVNKDELSDMIINTDLEKVTGPKDIWEKYVDLEDGRTLIVGYEEESKVCQGLTDDLTSGMNEEKCAITGTGKLGILKLGALYTRIMILI